MRRIGFVLLQLLVWAALVAPFAHAREVVLSVGQSMPPYVIRSENRGLEVDIVREALKLAGHSSRVCFAPLARVPDLLREGMADAALTMNRETAIEAECLSDSHIFYHNVAISLKEDRLKIQQPADLRGKSVSAFQRADLRLGRGFAEVIPWMKSYSETANQMIQLNLLFSGRVDVIIIERHILKALLKATPESDMVDLSRPYVVHDIFEPTEYRVGFNDAQLCDDFNAGLKQLRKSGRYDELVAEYLEE